MIQVQNKQQEQYEATLAKLRTLSGSQAERHEANRVFLVFFSFVILVVEALNIYVAAFPLLLHLVLLQVLIAYIALHWRYPAQRKLLVLAIPSIMRILLLGLPLEDVSSIYQWAVQGGGTLIVSLVLAFTLRLDWEDMGLTRKNLFVQFPIGLTGLLFGLSFSILLPFSVQVNPGNTVILAIEAALVFLLGMLEAFVFQGLILNTISSLLKNRLYAPFFVATIYTSLFLYYLRDWNNLFYVALVFGTSLFFSLMTSMSRNVLGACLAYGLLNLVVFIVLPMGVLNFML